MSRQEEKKRKAEDNAFERAKKKATDEGVDVRAKLGLKPKLAPLPTTSPMALGKTDSTDIGSLIEGTMMQKITGRIVNKTYVREFGGVRPGKVFSFDMQDNTGTIRVSVFGDTPNFDSIFEGIQLNSVLAIGGFKTGKMNPSYNNLTHPLEITWMYGTTYANAARGSKVPDIEFNFITIAQVLIADSDSLVDFVGIIVEIGSLEDVNNGPLKRITLADRGGDQIETTLWKSAASNAALELYATIAIKTGRIKKFKEVNAVNVDINTMMWLNPDLEEARELKTWFTTAMKD